LSAGHLGTYFSHHYVGLPNLSRPPTPAAAEQHGDPVLVLANAAKDAPLTPRNPSSSDHSVNCGHSHLTTGVYKSPASAETTSLTPVLFSPPTPLYHPTFTQNVLQPQTLFLICFGFARHHCYCCCGPRPSREASA